MIVERRKEFIPPLFDDIFSIRTSANYFYFGFVSEKGGRMVEREGVLESELVSCNRRIIVGWFCRCRLVFPL